MKNRMILFLLLGGLSLSGMAGDLDTELKRLQGMPGVSVTPDGADRYKVTYPGGYVKFVDTRDMGGLLEKGAGDMQIFDLPNIDDTQYADKYKFTQRIALGTGAPYPVLFGDFDNNGKIDMAGLYKNIQDGELGQAGIFELQDDSTFQQRYLYPLADSATTPTGVTDVDRDGRPELNISRGQTFYNYKSLHPDSLPMHINFKHVMWRISGIVGSELFGDFDGDAYADVYYMGDDTLDPWGNKLYIAEYDPAVNNFVQKYRFAPPDWRVGGSAAGDFDADGFKEIVAGNIHGNVYVMENRGDDAYVNSFTTSVDVSNAYLVAATNDIDQNGKTEFFVGASSYWSGVSGTRVFWFEANGDDSYEVKRTFFLNGTGVLGTTALYSYDVNNDKVDDLVFAFEFYVVTLIWNRQSGQFDLFYLYRHDLNGSGIQSATVYNVFSGCPDLFVSIYGGNNVPVESTLWFTYNTITSIGQKTIYPVHLKLYPNYPNPFNSRTQINFDLSEYSFVNLKIYDTRGKEVRTLLQTKGMTSGKHGIVWDGNDNNGKEVSTGIYFIKLTTDGNTLSAKLMYLK